jgi:hypothetical protein
MRVKENQFQFPGLILTEHPVRAAHPVCWPVMFHHQNFKCGDTAINNRRKCRTLASVGQTNGLPIRFSKTAASFAPTPDKLVVAANS